ncbi:hypothetical protein COO91_00570 [Nostoc flagelliforme CCNUN1]|uniref:Uncharacterized protein n=1 Tax=Nostoc flagelliforme CCNUN1 TaxID=2038116 RepID=A0A2K8SH08_9NOSO|nr:hypothetical protein COO91_00570 [Nostoc flagelliforme CCNUN1]
MISINGKNSLDTEIEEVAIRFGLLKLSVEVSRGSRGRRGAGGEKI